MSGKHPYTPTTDQIREGYIYDAGEAEYIDPINGHLFYESAGKWFDRWLEGEQARVRSEALKEAAQVAAEAMLLHKLPTPGTGPFTIQQAAADEARTQIAEKILKLGHHD